MTRLSVLTASLLVALAAATGRGERLEAQTFRMDFDYVDTSPCGFPVAVDGWLASTTTFVDADGAPIRRATRNQPRSLRVGLTGLVAWNNHAWNSSIDAPAGTQTITVLTASSARASAFLLNDVGRLVLQLADLRGLRSPFESGGQDSIFEPGVWDSARLPRWVDACGSLS